MTLSELFLPEYDNEMVSTRKVLERIPDDKLGWRAHPKSNTLGWNAGHLAEIPGWAELTLAQSSFDVAPPGKEMYRTPIPANMQECLRIFDKNVSAGRKLLEKTSDADMMKEWSLLQTGKPIFTFPRFQVIRSFVINHMIHHRAHVCVYLRLNDVPVPGMYGPSADDRS